MPIIAVSPDAGRLDVGSTWLLAVEVHDDVTGQLKDGTVTCTVTTPSLTTSVPTVTKQALGYFTAPYVLAAAGRHTAVVTSAGVVVGVATFAVDALAVTAPPTATDVQAYLNTTGATSFTLGDIGAALASEKAAQAAVCRVPAAYPADLGEALCRRVARNLAARSVPVASFSAFEGGATSTRVPMKDAEIARLEQPYKRLVVG